MRQNRPRVRSYGERRWVLEMLSRNGMPAKTAYTITTPSALERELDIVRAEGFATNHGESAENVLCIATAVRNYAGTVVAAVCIPMKRKTPLRGDESRLIRIVQQTGDRISESLGAQRNS